MWSAQSPEATVPRPLTPRRVRPSDTRRILIPVMTEGEIRDITTGRRRGRTADLEATFLAAVQEALAKEPCYVVLGTGSPDGFADRIRELGAPIVTDAALADAALIVAGKPEEWEGAGG